MSETGVGVLLTERVKMQTIHTVEAVGIKIFRRNPETGEGGTGIIDRMSLLRGALRIHAETDAAPCAAAFAPKRSSWEKELKTI